MNNVPSHGEMRVIIGVPGPLRLIARAGGEPWNVTLDDVNHTTYDWVKLSRVSGGFDGNIAPFAMLVCFDGSLVIPALPEFPNKQRAVEVFNRVLAEMFLGGEYTEAVAPTDICPGLILPTGYVRLSTSGGGAASNLHSSLRSGEAPSIDSIRLLGTKPLSIEKFEAAINRGRSVLSTAPSLSPELFLSGVTHFVREQWPEALVTIWTSTEQLLSHLWEVNIRSKVSDGIPGRKAFLADYRTWPVSTRIEVLFQQGFIDESLYSQLDLARKSRNAFIHDGRTPTTASVTSAVTGMFDLLARCSKDINNGSDAIHAKEMVLTKGKLEHTPVPGQKIDEENFVAWRRIRHLPGEKGWEGEFEGFELGFKPLEEIKEIHKTANSKKSLRSKSRKA